MGFVKGIVGKGNDLIIKGLGHMLGNAIGHAAGDILRFITVDEDLALFLDDLHLLFGDGAADVVRLAHSIAAKGTEDLNNLLLVDNTTIGNFQDRLQFRAFISDFLMIQLIFNEFWNGIHGAGTIQGDDSRNIFNTAGLHTDTDTGHTGRFQLEYALSLAFCQHPEGGGIIIRDPVH